MERLSGSKLRLVRSTCYHLQMQKETNLIMNLIVQNIFLLTITKPAKEAT